ncbi:hypothetical protein VNO80_28471 [Phaseolus coccineus]|uniref:RIN4 pathogenic type III effector avirulence factor Avr cleavage site domain-containing protein n=1 Tax=Phaseolus coccineus TaxID=3886 RepID=A0AAN9LE95_PHACN
MSVPQFGGWDQSAPGATDYSMVFTQARANKKHQKTNITEIRPVILENEGGFSNSNHGRAHHHGHGRGHGHTHAHGHEDPSVMGKRKMLTYINCCIKPRASFFTFQTGLWQNHGTHAVGPSGCLPVLDIIDNEKQNQVLEMIHHGTKKTRETREFGELKRGERMSNGGPCRAPLPPHVLEMSLRSLKMEDGKWKMEDRCLNYVS